MQGSKRLFSGIGVFRVFERDFPFVIGSSVRYFTILARSQMPRPIKILICRIGRGVPNDFDIVYKKTGNMAAFSVEGKKRKTLDFKVINSVFTGLGNWNFDK